LVRLSVKQVQKGEGVPLFRTPLEIRMVTGGVARTFQVDLAPRAEQAFAFPSEVEPDQLIVDPKNWVLKGMRFEKPAKLWRAELERAPEAIARALAARGLGRSGSVDDVPALRAALLGDGFWGVVAEAAGALGELRGPAAREALLAGLGVSHPKARRAVVKALGSFRGDAVVATALIELLGRGDPSYFVEAEAARSLGRTRDPRAVEVLGQVRGRPSYQEVIRSGAVEGLAATKDERALVLVLAETAVGLPMQSRRAAAGALVEFEGKREVCERLEELLDDGEFRVRLEAAERLGATGEARAVPALERVLRRGDEDGRVKRRARESLAALAAGKKPDGLRAELDALRAEVSRLRDEVAALRAPDVKSGPAPAVASASASAAGPARVGKAAAKASGKRAGGEKKAAKKRRVH
jgi:aminopeptidase N